MIPWTYGLACRRNLGYWPGLWGHMKKEKKNICGSNQRPWGSLPSWSSTKGWKSCSERRRPLGPPTASYSKATFTTCRILMDGGQSFPWRQAGTFYVFQEHERVIDSRTCTDWDLHEGWACRRSKSGAQSVRPWGMYGLQSDFLCLTSFGVCVSSVSCQPAEWRSHLSSVLCVQPNKPPWSSNSTVRLEPLHRFQWDCLCLLAG